MAATGCPGLIRGFRGIQEDINKRASKALYVLSTNRVIVDEGAVDDMDELAEEVARPDAFIVKKVGKELRIESDRELSDAHLALMSRSIQMVQQTTGVTDENLGLQSNARSGIAIERRQTQGAMATMHFFDNLRLACQVQGEKQVSLVEQFMSEKKSFRITNMRGSPEYISVNDGMPENDITRSKADYVISEADWRASMRQSAVDELMELMMKLAPANPQLAMVMLDLVVESSDIPNREEIVRRIRKMTGMSDPDADEPTPEEQARAQAEQDQQAMQQQLQAATLRKLVAEAVRTEMQAAKAQADTVRANITSLGGSKRGAVDIAADVMAAPQVAPVADALLLDAGYAGRGEKEQAALAEAQAIAEQQNQAAAPQLPAASAGDQYEA